MAPYRDEKWIYNTYYPTMGKLGAFYQTFPGLIALFFIIPVFIWWLLTKGAIPMQLILIIYSVSIISMMILFFINIRSVIQDAAPIKVKITDKALYFMKSSGKIIKIKLDDIEIVNLRKTIFDGCIVGIMERRDKNTVKHYTFYLSRELGEAIIKMHSKYVEYNI